MIVVGDVHGELDKLRALLTIIDRDYPGRLIVFAGDICDRGANTMMCYALVGERVAAGTAILIGGNHEDMFKGAIKRMLQGHTPAPLYLQRNVGGEATIMNYALAAGTTRLQGIAEYIVQIGHLELLDKALPFFETDEVLVTHAPIPKGAPEDEWRKSHELLKWGGPSAPHEEPGWAKNHGKLALCGHVTWALYGMFRHRVHGRQVYLDSGCGVHQAAPLTAAVIENGKIAGFISTNG